jgi:UDP-N-acetylmuramate dehydrogenase
MNLSEMAPVLSKEMTGTVEAHAPLGRFTTYRLGGPADLYVEPESATDLVTMGRVLRELGATEIDVLVLGRGSNMVISDDGWPGLAIKLGRGFSWIGPLSHYSGEAIEGNGLAAGSSTPLPQLGNWAARRGLSGLEFTVGVPGSVGGAVKMNAGAHGQHIADSLVATRIFDLRWLDMEERSADQLEMSYRHTNLGDHHLVVDAAFVLRTGDEQQIRKRMEQWRKHRSDTQPGALQNAGSTFKNPPGDSAGRLVEAAGLKGFTVGGASVSSKHANFFMASDGATAQDVYDLVSRVKKRVLETSGVTLEPEVRFIGRFREPA